MTCRDLLATLGLTDPKTIWGWLIFLSSLGIEFIPQIKLNPWSSLFKWIGGHFNTKLDKKISAQINELKDEMNKQDIELKKQVTNLDEKVDSIHTSLQDHIKESETKNLQDTRRDIQNFSNSCSNMVRHTKEEYDFYIHKCDDYEIYIKENDIKNGVIESAIKNIRRMYDKAIAENSFLPEHTNE